jgi:tRNA U34 5-carboxymethylaminomethyl modifying GTPase MnmE/TrmE
MMYTIDLLRGHGIPIRNRRGGMLIIAVTIAVPLIMAMVLYTQYLLHKIDINRMEISIRDRDKKILQMADAVKALSSLEKGEITMRECLVDVSSAIGRNVQWSPILRLIVENLPGTAVLNKLDVSLVMQSKQVPDKQDPKKMINVPQTLRKLRISLFEYSKSDSGEGVQRFIRAMRSSKVLADKVEDVRIAAQERDKADGIEVTRYDIDCIFKPQS